jgi:hypothetical protein
MPEPTAAELAKVAEQEAAVFAQAANVDKLLNMLDPASDNLADNEEIQVRVISSDSSHCRYVRCNYAGSGQHCHPCPCIAHIRTYRIWRTWVRKG